MAGDPLDFLGDGEPGPLYWVYGKERFLVDRAVARLRERVLDPRTRDFNYDLLYGKEAGPQKIIAAARTLPMMAKRRLIIVRDADGLDAKQLDQMLDESDDSDDIGGDIEVPVAKAKKPKKKPTKSPAKPKAASKKKPAAPPKAKRKAR